MCKVNNYEWYKEHHICVRCGQHDAEKNHVLCLECMMKNRESSLNYANRNREEIRKKNRISNIARYYKLKKLGICVSCGKRKTKNNKVHCQYCSAINNERKRKQYLLNIYAIKNMAEIRV